MLHFTLRQLEYAVLAAELGSIAAAAKTLGVAQPSVSAALKKLEDQLGLQIFLRQHAQGILPSSQGTLFITKARLLLAQAHDLEKESADRDGPLKGRLRLGSFLTLAPTYMPELLSKFNILHPNVEIELEEGVQEDLLTGLRNGRIDLALLYNLDLPPDIQVADVLTLKPHVLLSMGHRLAKNRNISLKSLASDPLILLDIQPSRSYFLGIFEAQGLKPLIGFSSASLELVRGMVARGMGYSLLITRPPGDRAYDGEQLAVREISGAVQRGVVSLASLKHIRKTRIAQMFETFCLAHFKSR